MKRLLYLLIGVVLFTSCNKTNEGKMVCMFCVDSTGTRSCDPFKQTVEWSIKHSTATSHFHVVDESDIERCQ